MTVDAPTDAAARRRALMRTLERALYDAFADSAELHRTIWDLQREGFQIRLTIACEPGATAAGAAARPALPAGETASFRIDSEDLRFLRSIGIDPTRTRRPRRKS
jgi:hypothetical protein